VLYVKSGPVIIREGKRSSKFFLNFFFCVCCEGRSLFKIIYKIVNSNFFIFFSLLGAVHYTSRTSGNFGRWFKNLGWSLFKKIYKIVNCVDIKKGRTKSDLFKHINPKRLNFFRTSVVPTPIHTPLLSVTKVVPYPLSLGLLPLSSHHLR